MKEKDTFCVCVCVLLFTDCDFHTPCGTCAFKCVGGGRSGGESLCVCVRMCVSERERENSNLNLKTLFYKDYRLRERERAQDFTQQNIWQIR